MKSEHATASRPTTPPVDPIAAVTHSDPYPYYAALVRNAPFYRDGGLGLWVATSAGAVRAVLDSESCLVRPVAEPVPRALLGSPAEGIFRLLIRMNDGESHCPYKRAVSTTLASIVDARASDESRAWARVLASDWSICDGPDRVSRFATMLPVFTIAGLLGVPPGEIPNVAAWTCDFTRCLAQDATPVEIARGTDAAGHLNAAFRAILSNPSRPGGTGLDVLAAESARVGRGETELLVANSIGLLVQSCDATAGLIGNTLLALAAHPDIRSACDANAAVLCRVVAEVQRFDAPVQNTRRFVAGGEVIAGQQMEDGDAILVVLAAANRDPAANPDPDRFDIQRKRPTVFSFGSGLHSCPGEALALAIAAVGVEQLLISGVEPMELAATVAYRPSANARIPVWPAP